MDKPQKENLLEINSVGREISKGFDGIQVLTGNFQEYVDNEKRTSILPHLPEILDADLKTKHSHAPKFDSLCT